MPTDEPAYARYTLDELQDAYAHIDRLKYPERAERLRDELEKRRSEASRRESLEVDLPLEAESAGLESQLARRAVRAMRDLRLRRATAFLYDYFLVVVLAAGVDNLVSAPVPELLLEFVAPVLFVLYFIASTFVGRPGTSLGKQLVGVETMRADGTPVTTARIAARASVLALLVLFPWESLLSALSRGSLPVIVLVAITAIRSVLIIYSILMVLRDPGGRTLHDQVAKTKVILTKLPESLSKFLETLDPLPTSEDQASEVVVEGPRARRGIERPMLLLPALAIALGGALVFGAFVSGVLEADPLDYVRTPIGEVSRVERILEGAVAESHSIRSRIGITTSVAWNSSEPESRRGLTVDVWIPAVSWNPRTRDEVMETVLENLKVTPGFYDEGAIRVWTGFQYLSFTVTKTLVLPEPQG